MTIKTIHENGVFMPQEPVHLDEHTEVEVSIPARVPLDASDPAVGRLPRRSGSSWMRRPTWRNAMTHISALGGADG